MTTQNAASPLPPPQERRRLRVDRSLTPAQVAEQVGVSCSMLRAWESGHLVPHGSRGEAYARLLTTFILQETVEGATAARTRPQEPAAAAPADPLTPAQAFDALYAFCAPALLRQTYLLTGRRELARESVERAFQLAWQRWPEVARDRDPAGWVRAVAHDCALSPWHRFRPRYRSPEPPPADQADQALLRALLELPPVYRRTLVLYDGVGLDLPETAAETEASTPAAASRLTHAREALAAQQPDLADPAELQRRLPELASAEQLHAAGPTVVRTRSERRNVFWTRAAIAFTTAIVGATALMLWTAPTHYEAPIPPAQAVEGVPPPGVMGPLGVRGPLSPEEQALRDTLRKAAASGPARLVPQLR
ncbi:sigma factor-like helix-turn-helix DNA-binding protein [Streptomyces sp. NPDC052109]|uniref:sigma factor-like helix-turn-helix DNA-binding protein n=1 Tax=Streptomyces sp. NPDC052109 TaxID=3155527 RepID=UPI0034379981